MALADLKVYWVETPEYETYLDYFPEFGTGPRGTVRDFLEVQAHTKRQAVSIAVNQWLAAGKEKYSYDPYYAVGRKQDGLCPWTGIRAEEAKCSHGVPMPVDFDGDFWCDECQKDWDNHCE